MRNIKDLRIAIVSSSFRKEVSGNLEKHCLATFRKQGLRLGQVTIYRVPGSLEIPLAVKKLAKSGKYDAIIAFGAIVKGKTYHFEQIANECIRGCMDASWQYEVPVIFEVLAVYDLKDAMARATRKTENKGVEAALTAMEMIRLMKKL